MPGSGCQFWEVTVPHGTHWPLQEAEVTTVRVADIPSGIGEGPLFSGNLLENSVLDRSSTALCSTCGGDVAGIATCQEPEDKHRLPSH